MKRLLLLFFLLYPLLCHTQNYRHIGVESGLSSRKVYFIQKDNTGYMWLLTHEGIDRYDGKEFKHYILGLDGNEISSLQDLNWLYIDKQDVLWEIGKKGRIFKYNPLRDSFDIEYQLPVQGNNDNPTPISFSFIDNNDVIWLCGDDIIYQYDPKTKYVNRISNNLGSPITFVTQYDDTHYFAGTETGIFYIELLNDKINIIPTESLKELSLQINELYFDFATEQLFIGTFQRGVYIFNKKTGVCTRLQTTILDSSVTRIKPLNKNELLIATDGAGIHKLNIETHKTIPYIVADYNQFNKMNGNNINDIYIDQDGRIWIANYPIGITIRDDRYSQFEWIKHSIGNPQSLINDRINAIIEDTDGDLWFATNNGISLYHTKTKEWKAFLSTFNPSSSEKNHTYLSICEATPGIIYAAGYSSALYKIVKKTSSVSILSFDSYKSAQYRPDKYIEAITKDSQGHLWIGGYYNLKYIDEENKEIKLYPKLNSITAILEKDEQHMWIGSSKGLFMLNKESGASERIVTPTESTYIYSLCQTTDGKLYIGTNGAGLLIYNPANKSFIHFHSNNSALLSNNIYTILTDGADNIVFSSESCLTRFYPKDNDFHNWTREQGLTANHFNPNSGVLRKVNNSFMFGSSDGAVEFNKNMQLPRDYSSKMVLSDFKLFYQSIYPGDPKSPLKETIDNTEILELNYNQNIFSLKVSSINYDYPSNTLYSWKLEGFYDIWSRPGAENIIRFTNLSPGEYTLHIRAISNENRQILEERNMIIIVKPPFWRSTWFLLFYMLVFGLISFGLFRIIYLRKQRKTTYEKFQFFINTAHDIRTPLTLIKAPLEEIKDKEQLTETGNRNMSTAIRNVNVLLRLTTNLINFERMDLYSSDLYIAEYELNTFMADIFQSFNSYTEIKKINYTYESNFKFLNVWFDKEKMDSIVKNIISNAVKYTPDGGSVHVSTMETGNYWSIEVKDTGIGIPAGEQKKLFKTHFRGSNAINSKITGSGIGMVLVARLIELHKGKISLSSVEHKGTTIKLTFQKGYEHFKRTHMVVQKKDAPTPLLSDNDDTTPTFDNHINRRSENGQRILVVEDNDELRSYLDQTLSDEYSIQTCENGKEALTIVKEYKPDLIISDIMMPEMRGDELCTILKNDIETSHIPIVLLTALNDEKNIMRGLQIGADEYIIKPFNIGILRATLANLLVNRAILRNKYAKLEIEATQEEACSNCSTGIDWEFIASLKTHVEENMTDPQFNIDMIAALMNMSRTSLYSKVKALTDLAPGDYVRLIRLSKAAELLLEGKYNVTEVSEMTGFNDAKYFREVFKKQYKVSPSKYKG